MCISHSKIQNPPHPSPGFSSGGNLKGFTEIRAQFLVLTGVFFTAPLPLVASFMSNLKGETRLIWGEAEACCGAEDVTAEEEFRHSGDSVQTDVGRAELGNHSVVIFLLVVGLMCYS